IGPDGSVYYNDTGPRNPGVYRLSWPAAGGPPLQGRWQWVVSAVDDLGQHSSVDRGFAVNNTLGFLRPDPRALAVPRVKARAIATVTVSQAATVLAWVESATGAPIANVQAGRVSPGQLVLQWDGRSQGGSTVYPGPYVLDVVASNGYGRVELTAPFTVAKAKFKVLN